MAQLQFNNQQIDPYLCTCGPCKRFWRDTFRSSSDCLARTGEDRAANSATLGKLKPDNLATVGDRVMVQGQPGSVKFVGFVDDNTVAPSLRIGIKLDESVHLGHDGMLNGKRYFYCTNGHGTLVRYKDVQSLRPPTKRPPVKGNAMFPSWPEICKRRKQREAMLEEMHKKNMKATQCSTARPPKPPAISPRDNRAQQLRREKTNMTVDPGQFLIVRDDPYDIAFRDQKHHKKRELLVASLSTPETSQASWEKGLMQQWRRKYDDPDKASRMGETLLKLCSAYKEGFKYKHI
ncbi:uncharacterized protein [Littorina saxatilis]|uniref:CAP-Gly domain-containing protein n=1 Tax=Littorina saxatilis TaxID=31220 RepID=A0AAN9GQ02_9CAEN